MIYYLHIAGTSHHDQKWLFHDKLDLQRFLGTLPLEEISIEIRVYEDIRVQKYKIEIDTLRGQKALDYWDKHITVLQIKKDSISSKKKMFYARFWDGLLPAN